MNINKIEFPEIKWELIEQGALPKGEVLEGEIEKMLKFLMEVQVLKTTSYLAKETLDKAREIDQKLEELKKQFPQLVGVTQNILGRKIKEMASKPGDSRTLFSRLRILTAEAEFQGALQECKAENLAQVPRGIKDSFLVQLYNPKTKEASYFIPRNWRKPGEKNVHKQIAIILRDLSFKARETYRSERGITASQKPETLAEILAKSGDFVQGLKTEPKPKTEKTKPEKGTPKKGAKAAIRTESREKDDKKEILDAKKGKISLTDDPKALDFLKK